MRAGRATLSLLVILSLGLISAGYLARADVLKLRDGRQWEGTIISETDQEVVIRTAGGPVTVPKSDIATLSRGPSRQEQYAERRRALAEGDVAGHLALARWCREQNLVSEARGEYQVVLTLDPENAEAHQALGHQQVEGRWLTFEEAMAARGLVQHDGRWLEPAQAEQAEKEEGRQKQELEWRQRLQGLVRTILSGSPGAEARARVELLAVDDPGAATAVVDLLRHPNPRIQLLALTLVEERGFPGGDKPLVDIALGSDVPEVARLARLALVKTARGEALKPLVEALGSARREVRHRAAVILGEIGDPRVVPFLIDAIPEPMPVEEFTSPTVGLSPNQPTERAIEATTAPGVAVMMPRVQQFTSGTSMGTGGTLVEIGTAVNYDAVDALEAITRVQLGGDQAAWGRWWAREGDSLLRRARPRQ
jgi:RNase P/RNase MRP subunit p29